MGGLVGATALSSAVFNFLIKFGITRESPVAVSLATQIGIPLNLLLDMVIVRAHINATQVVGTLVMLVSFTLFQGSNRMAPAARRLPGEDVADGYERLHGNDPEKPRG